MQFTALAVGIGVLALVVLWFGLRTLLRGRWFLAWLRGTCGLAVIMLALLTGALAYDISTYKERQSGTAIAMLHVGIGDHDRYRITFDDGSGSSRTLLLDGELWGLSVRVLDWGGLASVIGLQPGYRLNELNARFLSIEQQNTAQYIEQPLTQSWPGLDVWQLLQWNGGLPFAEASLARLSFIPLADGASYRVEWLPTGLQARPMNDEARRALRNWVE